MSAKVDGKAWLEQLAGEWTFDGRSVPDDPQHHRTGTETVRTTGCWVVIESSDEARMTLAFDPASGKVVGDFIHLAHPTLWVYEGAFDSDGRTLRLASRGPSFDVEGETSDYEDVIELISPDERVLTGRMKNKDGSWRDFCVTRYRRKG